MSNMTNAQLKKAERLAEASRRYANQSLKKSAELEAYLSMLEYKAGNTQKYRSVDELFKKLKIA